MSKPTRIVVQNGLNGWDADVNSNHQLTLDAPFPLFKHAGDQTDLQSAFPAASHDDCFVWVTHTVLGLTLYHSEGGTWRITQLRQNVRNLAGAAGLAVDDQVVLCANGGGAYNVTLPAPGSAAGRTYRIKRTGATDIVTVVPNGAETIDGAANYALSAQYDGADFYSDGTNWSVLSSIP